MKINNIQANNYNNQPNFGAYFSTKNAIHLKRLCNQEFDKLSKLELKEKLDWFANELPNHELEITQFENLPEIKIGYKDISVRGRNSSLTHRVINRVRKNDGRYTIINKNTGNSANIWADNIFQFFDGIKEQSGTLFNKAKNSLTEGLDEFGTEIITKLTSKQ